MKDVKRTVLEYFDDLKYQVTSQTHECYQLKQKRTGLEVELDFSCLGKGVAPTDMSLNKDKKLIALTLTDIENIGFEKMESIAETLDEHCSFLIYEEEFFEQTMKEIWMFLSNDPRERDVFNDSRFYKPS